jgi:hypothetical protein
LQDQLDRQQRNNAEGDRAGGEQNPEEIEVNGSSAKLPYSKARAKTVVRFAGLPADRIRTNDGGRSMVDAPKFCSAPSSDPAGGVAGGLLGDPPAFGGWPAVSPAVSREEFRAVWPAVPREEVAAVAAPKPEDGVARRTVHV